MLDHIAIDTHTHTILSGHAWSTLTENAKAAADRGLTGLCLTEHGPRIPGGAVDYLPAAQKMLPRRLFEIDIYQGTETNIVDFNGAIDIPMRFLDRTDFAIASLHDIVIKPGNSQQNTAGLIGALNHPFIDMLGHIDDAKVPCDFEAIILEAKKLGKIIEINNNSLLVRRGSEPNIIALAKLCMQHSVRICVSSDAHFWTMIGDVEPALKVLRYVGFPEELVANRSKEAFEQYLRDRKVRLENCGFSRNKPESIRIVK